MKRNFKNVFFALLLSVVFLFAACGDKNPQQQEQEQSKTLTPVEISVRGDEAGGTHIYNITGADRYLVRNGQSEYKVVHSEGGSSLELLAANEMVNYIYSATEVAIESITDAEVDANSDRYIFIGKTTQTIAEELVPTREKVGDKGFIIKSVGNSVYVIGHTDEGTLNGVYELLYQLVSFEAYGSACLYYDKGLTAVKLNNYDITDVPDIPYNVLAIGNAGDAMKQMQFCNNGWISINKHGYHNSFGYLPPEQYKAEHPEYYSTCDKQLCYLAHGDEEARQEMIDIITETMKAHLIQFPDQVRVSVNQEDTGTWCNCDACKESIAKYGSGAASVIQMLNEVDDNIIAWFETAEGAPYKRDLDIAFFAYHMTEDAPVKFDEATQTYVPIDDTVKMNDNVCVFYAPINAQYDRPLNHETNYQYYETMKKWSCISKRMYLWPYSTNFHYYLAPFDSFSSMQENAKIYREFNVYHIFDQNQYNVGNSTGFTILKAYLSSKLMWNVNLNINELIDDFFDKYYGIASDVMKELFENLRTNFVYMREEQEYGGGIFFNPIQKNLFSKDFLNQSIALYKKALKVIEPLKKTDTDEYDRITKAIMTESITFRYLLIQIYGLELGDAELLQMKRDFKADVELLNITNIDEGTTVSALFSSWKI